MNLEEWEHNGNTEIAIHLSLPSVEHFLELCS